MSRRTRTTSDDPIEKLITAIEAHNWDQLYAHVREAAAINAHGNNRPDGYPTSTPGSGSVGGGGGRRLTVEDEHGNPEEVPTTSTEAAAFSRIDQPRPRDEVRRILRADMHALIRIATALDTIKANSARLTNLRSPATVDDPPQCHVASTIHKLPFDLSWEPFTTTTFDGYLPIPFDEPRKVCRWTYAFVRRWRRLPTELEMRTYLSNGYVRIHEPSTTNNRTEPNP